jgi:hypothetical protein
MRDPYHKVNKNAGTGGSTEATDQDPSHRKGTDQGQDSSSPKLTESSLLDCEPMDMEQQVALLCIPELQRVQNEVVSPNSSEKDDKGVNGGSEAFPISKHPYQQSPDPMALFEAFLRILCNSCQTEPGLELTKDILLDIIEHNGERWSEEAVDEMLAIVAKHGWGCL